MHPHSQDHSLVPLFPGESGLLMFMPVLDPAVLQPSSSLLSQQVPETQLVFPNCQGICREFSDPIPNISGSPSSSLSVPVSIPRREL